MQSTSFSQSMSKALINHAFVVEETEAETRHMVFGIWSQTGRILDPLAYCTTTGKLKSQQFKEVSALTIKIIWRLIDRQFFQCRIFAMKNIRNLKSFLGSSQNYFVF
jgi:hypothetical protein